MTMQFHLLVDQLPDWLYRTTTKMSDSLQLSQLLNKRWLEKLGPIIEKQPQVETYIGVNRQKTFPKREQTFRALNEMEPEDCKVVIFGQDPCKRLIFFIDIKKILEKHLLAELHFMMVCSYTII